MVEEPRKVHVVECVLQVMESEMLGEYKLIYKNGKIVHGGITPKNRNNRRHNFNFNFSLRQGKGPEIS